MAPRSDADVGDQASTSGLTAGVVVAANQRERRLLASLLDESEQLVIETRAVLPDRIAGAERDGDGAREADALIVLYAETEAAGEQIAEARRAFPMAKLVLVTPQDETGRTLRAAVRAQVEAVVYAEHVTAALAPTVRAVLAEQVVFPRIDRRRTEMPSLSHRERQVVSHAVQGLTNDEIAQELYLATSTVKSHLTSAFAKLAVRSRSEAAAVLLDPDEPAGRMVLIPAVEPDEQPEL